MRFSLLLALSLCPAAAAAQEQKPPAQEERPAASPAEPAPRLNLRLDDAARYSREAPRESPGAAGLPALGGDARPLPARSLATPLDGPFPKDSERGER
jgi:hypothetical protein